MNAKQREMLATIEDQLRMQDHKSKSPVVQEIARWLVCGYSENWGFAAANTNSALLQSGFMDDLRDVWPEATDEHIRRGLELAVAAAAKAAER